LERQRLPKPGEIYRHFKNNLYQIITIATHSETGEQLVVYQALYGTFQSYARPLEMFLSEVDHTKYPEATQKYRFELYQIEEQKSEVPDQKETDSEIRRKIRQDLQASLSKTHRSIPSYQDCIKNDTNVSRFNHNNPINEEVYQPKEAEGEVNSILLDFLDAASYQKKLEVLSINRKHITDRLINDMAVSLDCSIEEGDLEERYQGLMYCLQAMSRFENKRLR
jgi:hypothetical protein